MTESEKKPEAKKIETNKKSSRKIIVWVVGGTLGVIVLFVVGAGIAFYTGWQGVAADSVAKVLPYPAARVDGSFVTLAKYNDNVRAISKYIESQRNVEGQDPAEIDSALRETRPSTLYRMMEDLVVQKISSDAGISVSNDDVNNEFDSVVSQFGTEQDVADELDKLYGWDIATFKGQVLKNQILKEKLHQKFLSSDEFTPDAKKKADDVLKRIKDGEDFAKVAAEVSQDYASAKDGGDLGKVEKGNFVPEFENAALKLEPGQVSELVRTDYGYHIIKLEEKNDKEFRARHILIAADFNSYLHDEVKNVGVDVYAHGVEWDDVEDMVVNVDIDGDGLKNAADDDDDGDGASDKDEEAAGSSRIDATSTPDTVNPKS